MSTSTPSCRVSLFHSTPALSRISATENRFQPRTSSVPLALSHELPNLEKCTWSLMKRVQLSTPSSSSGFSSLSSAGHQPRTSHHRTPCSFGGRHAPVCTPLQLARSRWHACSPPCVQSSLKVSGDAGSACVPAHLVWFCIVLVMAVVTKALSSVLVTRSVVSHTRMPSTQSLSPCPHALCAVPLTLTLTVPLTTSVSWYPWPRKNS
mmetsp:Transcript_10093/g.31616  ORF Transcript_10093/g.31616 Transcript_10093/m.31616 type:complete len:207 (-) Transcript_10093:155-775(-)